MIPMHSHYHMLYYSVDTELSTITLYGSRDKRKFQVTKFCSFSIVSQQRLGDKGDKRIQERTHGAKLFRSTIDWLQCLWILW